MHTRPRQFVRPMRGDYLSSRMVRRYLDPVPRQAPGACEACGYKLETLVCFPKSSSHHRSGLTNPPEPSAFDGSSFCASVSERRPGRAFSMINRDEVPMLADRRRLLALLAGIIAMPAGARAQAVSRITPRMSNITAYAFSFAGLEGGDIRLADYAGKPILVVNTASLAATHRNTPDCSSCGHATTSAVWRRRRALERFGGQEPGTLRRHQAHCPWRTTASAFRSPPRRR